MFKGNFINDCPDGEDEISCGYNNITFENENYGKWNFSEDGLFVWTVGSDGDDYFSGPSIGKLNNKFNNPFEKYSLTLD